MPIGADSLAARFPRESWKVNLILALALILLAVGLFAPLVTLETLFIFSDTISVASALWRLLSEGHFGLFVLIGGFSVLFPVLKLGVLARLWNMGERDTRRYRKHLHWLAQYGKWSMLDVFVVAVLIVSAKAGGLARVEVHSGLYAFAGSVLLTALATSRVSAAVRRGETTQGA